MFLRPEFDLQALPRAHAFPITATLCSLSWAASAGTPAAILLLAIPHFGCLRRNRTAVPGRAVRTSSRAGADPRMVPKPQCGSAWSTKLHEEGGGTGSACPEEGTQEAVPDVLHCSKPFLRGCWISPSRSKPKHFLLHLLSPLTVFTPLPPVIGVKVTPLVYMKKVFSPVSQEWLIMPCLAMLNCVMVSAMSRQWRAAVTYRRWQGKI